MPQRKVGHGVRQHGRQFRIAGDRIEKPERHEDRPSGDSDRLDWIWLASELLLLS